MKTASDQIVEQLLAAHGGSAIEAMKYLMKRAQEAQSPDSASVATESVAGQKEAAGCAGTPERSSVPAAPLSPRAVALTFDEFRRANVTRCVKWHPAGIESWSPSDWLTAVTGELGELASLLKMRNRERDGLPGNKFSPTQKQIADEIADVLTYLDLLAASMGVDLAAAAVEKFNEVSKRVGFPDRIAATLPEGGEPGEPS